ncbi:hypothetical protein BDY19DRAFT_935566 [Irpex rosettiformis]|uniref:Uncharacterized protein n=1 Tax=Irpex rosettiformis TaxID=378272 RepID=A0ACB8U8F7_9APHY|nr:hypothetical protein BDY19DRAFT_935566 [Irpex rosettiformis]
MLIRNPLPKVVQSFKGRCCGRSSPYNILNRHTNIIFVNDPCLFDTIKVLLRVHLGSFLDHLGGRTSRARRMLSTGPRRDAGSSGHLPGRCWTAFRLVMQIVANVRYGRNIRGRSRDLRHFWGVREETVKQKLECGRIIGNNRVESLLIYMDREATQGHSSRGAMLGGH